ncbi:ABC transporter permease [Arcticibacter tournemirensis]|nr:ABC transporter permease [Arcticibacter tournemirensis]
MILNFLKTSLRYLYRNKMFAALNILGLSIGISACWVIFCVVDYEFSFDNTIPRKEHIYRVISGFVYDGRESLNGGVPKPLPELISTQIAGVTKVVRVYAEQMDKVGITGGKGFNEPENLVRTDKGYFTMVPYKWLAGSPETVFSGEDEVVLTESRANKYFPGISADKLIGKTISYNDTIKKAISGVVRDLELPTAFIGKEFFSIKKRVYEEAEWTSTNGDDKVYIELADQADPEKVLKDINRNSKERSDAYNRKTNDFFAGNIKQWHELRSLRDIHFSPEIGEAGHKMSKTVVYGLMIIGFFLLLLAAINYVNLSTAQIPQRTKEFGVRKTLGGASNHLIGQIFTETFLIAIFSLLLSFAFSRMIFIALKDIIPDEVPQYINYKIEAAFFLVMAVFLPLIAGAYPAALVSKVDPLAIIRKRVSFPLTGRLNLRKSLIVFQFLVAQVFIIATLIVASQMRFVMRKELGFNRNAVVLVDIPWNIRQKEEYKNKQFSLLNEIRNVPGVVKVSLGDPPMQSGYSSSQFSYNGPKGKTTTGQLYRKEVDSSYIGLYGIKLIAGRNLRQSDIAGELVINETAVKHFGFKSPEDALGKMMENGDGKLTIVGVIKDFHSQTFYNRIDPTALFMNKAELGTFNIKLNSDASESWQQTIGLIRKKWNEFYPADYFGYKFYDQNIEEMYKHEKNVSLLINLSTLISVVISCLGLFGLASLTAFQRTREIGIRKVLGATVSGIIKMLSVDFIKLILVSITIGLPISWYAMNKWLEGFAYRIHIHWWMLISGGTVVIVIALLTISFQAFRAASARPVESLKVE